MVVLEEDSEEPYTCLLPQGFAQLESWKEMGTGHYKKSFGYQFLAMAFFFCFPFFTFTKLNGSPYISPSVCRHHIVSLQCHNKI